MTRFGLSLLAVAFSSAAHAELVAKDGTDGWCQSYENTRTGVWFFPDGSEALLFRVGIMPGEGCYAWLHDVPQWGLEAGFGIGAAERRGDVDVISFPSGVEVHLLPNGTAENHRQGFVIYGQVRE